MSKAEEGGDRDKEDVIQVLNPLEWAIAEPTLEEKEWKPPPYGVPGNILLRVTNVGEKAENGTLEFEIEDADTDTSVFWLNEGVGWEWGITECLGLGLKDFPVEGWYVIEGVIGYYHRGDGYTTDDDEEWEHKLVRPATLEEIQPYIESGSDN